MLLLLLPRSFEVGQIQVQNIISINSGSSSFLSTGQERYMDKEEHDLCPPPQTTVNIAGGDL